MVMAGLFGFANSLSFVQLELIMDKNSIFFTYASINVLGFFYLLMFLPNMEMIAWKTRGCISFKKLENEREETKTKELQY